MIIVGAKGFAIEVLEIFNQLNENEELFFFDDTSSGYRGLLYNRFKILHSMDEVEDVYQSVSRKFTIGIGNPELRNKMFRKFSQIGGEFTSTISPYAHVGHFGNNLGKGLNIMTGTVITNDITIGDGVLINLNCTIGHNTTIGQFSELSPGVHVSGRCVVGDFCSIGTGTVLLPGVSLGENVVVGAGSVITKNVEKDSVVVGVPGKVIEKQ